jgi:iron-sulfur cluster assembly protein
MIEITVTDVAAKKIQQNLQRRGHGVGIRVGVRTTGCSGFAYVLEYVDQVSEHEGALTIQANNNVNIFLDCKDEPYLNGMTIDYVRQGLNEGFEFVNPNERDRCGCGESFRV